MCAVYFTVLSVAALLGYSIRYEYNAPLNYQFLLPFEIHIIRHEFAGYLSPSCSFPLRIVYRSYLWYFRWFFYYWFGKISRVQFLELLGKIHFSPTFKGVNLILMLMYFLGLAGMARRIPHYPDSYFIEIKMTHKQMLFAIWCNSHDDHNDSVFRWFLITGYEMYVRLN